MNAWTRKLRSAKAAWRFAMFLLWIALAAPLFALDTPPAATAPAAVPADRQADHIVVLTIEGPIDTITYKSLERRMAEARAQGADAVVIELNTPGGEVPSALDICTLLKDRQDTPANVVAWVHPTAYSAGAIIALACREIVVSPNATMGDAAPILFNPVTGLDTLGAAERAKIEAPLLTEVIDSARRNHYDENLVQAFISVGVELWLIENTTTHEQAVVTREEYQRVFGEEPPQELVRTAPPKGKVEPLVRQFPADRTETNSDSVQLTPEQYKAAIEDEQQLPPSRAPLTEEARGQWKLLGQVISNDRLLTMKTAEIMHYGLGAKVISNDEELKAYFGASKLTRLDESWSEGLVRVLVSMWIRGFLLVIFLICGFIELHTPGMGVFGGVALVALLILLGAPALAGLASWWELLLIAVGVLLVVAEIFVIPGFGVAGISGIACLLVGIVGTFVSGDLRSPAGQEQLWTGLGMTFLAIFVSGVALWFISKQLETLPLLNRVVLKSEGGGASVAVGTSGLIAAMGAAGSVLAPGDVGVAETDLRPSGRASFEGRLVDVQAIGSYVSRGSTVRVVSVGRFMIEVEETTA